MSKKVLENLQCWKEEEKYNTQNIYILSNLLSYLTYDTKLTKYLIYRVRMKYNLSCQIWLVRSPGALAPATKRLTIKYIKDQTFSIPLYSHKTNKFARPKKQASKHFPVNLLDKLSRTNNISRTHFLFYLVLILLVFSIFL